MNLKIKNKIEELKKLINKWNDEYFNLEKPSVDDRVYDTHLKELIELEEQYPEFSTSDSPTKNIGSSTKNKFKKVIHNIPMLSLNKAYNHEELEKFFNDILIITKDENINFLVQPKIDGLSISLIYKNGQLIQASTRGDGNIGEDVTFNVKNIITDIPVYINYKNLLEVRGEIYIDKKTFLNIINNEKIEYANPRNLASGTLRQLNPEIVKKRNLSSFIYEIVEPEKHNINDQEQLIIFLKENKFPILKDYLIININKKNKIFEYLNLFENENRKKIEYEIDGMVIKLNEMKFYKQIGFTSKFPKYSIAYKFDEELVKTIIENIFITIGRTGIVTYNAKLKKVLLKGTTVSAATLHNYNYVKDLGINIGDEVVIKKAGDIIPKVVSLSKKNSNVTFNKIETCPFCNSKLIDSKTFNNQICINNNCPEINIKKIVHFSSKTATNIEGLGDGVVRKLYELNFLKKIEDIYKLENYKEQIISNKGFGKKFWNNLNDAIKKSYNVQIDKLIYSLGMPQLGSKNAKTIAKLIKKFDNIFNLKSYNLLSIKDIGDITLNEIDSFLNNQENIKLINFLISIGINPEWEKNKNKSFNFFENKTFVISGVFNISRNEIVEIIENSGGFVSNNISKKTYALLLGDNGGSKKEKAQKLGIQIIEKEKFYKIINLN